MWLAIVMVALMLLVKIFEPNIKGYIGESRVNSSLLQLPKQYRTINNLMIKNEKDETSQIDHVVVSPEGIFVIETKNYTGLISGDEKVFKWTKNIYGKKYEFMNPIMQNEGHIRALKFLLSNCQGLKFYSVVAFDNKCELKNVISFNSVMYINEVNKYILSMKSQNQLTDDQINRIYNFLIKSNITDATRRKEHVKRIKSKSEK